MSLEESNFKKSPTKSRGNSIVRFDEANTISKKPKQSPGAKKQSNISINISVAEHDNN